MEENQGTFKIDLSASDGVEEKISNIVPTKKSNGSKPNIPEPPAAKNPSTTYIAIGLVFISILFAFGYFNLRNAIKTINISGAEEFASLSKELNEKIATVNQLMEEQKKTIKNDISGIGTKVKTLESSVASITKTEKTSKSELQSGISDIKKQMDGLKQQADKIGGKTDELGGSISKIQAASQKNQQDIEKISTANIDAVKLEAALKKERDANKQTINTLTNDVSTLKKSIKDLEDRVNRLKSQTSTARSNTTKTPASGTPSTKPGNIIEEEIN